MQRYDYSANCCTIYAEEQGPWRSWIQDLSKNDKKVANSGDRTRYPLVAVTTVCCAGRAGGRCWQATIAAFEGSKAARPASLPLAAHRQPQRWQVLLASFSISVVGLSRL